MPGMQLGAGYKSQIVPAFTELWATGELKKNHTSINEKQTRDNSYEGELHGSVKMQIGELGRAKMCRH